MALPRHRELMRAAIERDAEAQEALLAGDREAALGAFRSAADLYRRSWEQSPPGSYGRLVGMLKSSVLAGEASEAAAYAREALAGEDPVTASPTASYARALAALIAGEDGDARRWSKEMAAGGDAFERTARAIGGLAAHDGPAYTDALNEIVRDFEERQRHLTGVAIADTALMLERLAAARGISAEVQSPLLPSI
jgi:hypothetical protein